MTRQNLFMVAALSGMMALGACSEEVINETSGEQPGRQYRQLQVMTRADDGTAADLRLYVFDGDGKCVASAAVNGDGTSGTGDGSSGTGGSSTIGNSTSVSILLKEGSYSVYAIGVDDGCLVLPDSRADARKDMPLTLANDKKLSDVLTAQASVTLTDGGENATTLNLTRQVMLLQGITIEQVPTTMTAVSVSIEPLHETLLLDGSFSGENGRHTVSLERDGTTRTWRYTGSDYLYPSVGKPKITVTFTDAGGKSISRSYTADEPMPANHKFTITGKYTAAVDVTLSATLVAASWDESKSISFEFDDETSETTSGDNGSGGSTETKEDDKPSVKLPEVGTLYKNKYYVLASSGNTITILSNTDKQNIISTKIEDINDSSLKESINSNLKNWDKTIDANWRLMTFSEAENIADNIAQINYVQKAPNISSSGDYYIQTEDGIYEFSMSTKAKYAELRPQTMLCPVADIVIE